MRAQLPGNHAAAAQPLQLLGNHPAGGRDLDVVHDSPAVGVAKLGTGKAFRRGEVLEVFAADPAGIGVQVSHVELDTLEVLELVDAYWSC